jgi:hypothetical protein
MIHRHISKRKFFYLELIKNYTLLDLFDILRNYIIMEIISLR